MLDSRIGKLGQGARGLVTAGNFYGQFSSYVNRYRRAFPHVAGAIAGGPIDLNYYGAMAATLQGLGAVHGDLSGERAGPRACPLTFSTRALQDTLATQRRTAVHGLAER